MLWSYFAAMASAASLPEVRAQALLAPEGESSPMTWPQFSPAAYRPGMASPDSFSTCNDVSFALQDLLEEDELDLVLCAPSERYSDIVFFDLAEQPLYVCLYPTHPLANRKELLPEDLTGQAMVGHTKSGLFYKLYEVALRDLKLHPRIVAEADEDNSLLSLVRSRLGLCIVAMNPTLNTEGLVTVPFRQDKVKRFIALGCKKSRLEEFDLQAILRQL